MLILGTILTIAFALTIAWGALTESQAADMWYSEPKALAKANAQAYAQALATVDKVVNKPTDKVVNSGFSRARRPACKLALHVEPRFATIARAKSTARTIGIRLRPTNQAMRKAYMRQVNALGLDFAAARELDLMLAS